jgi:NAD(P)-dependent dehydrogenase (short-subunit alcohol dehydrogenase family)
VSTESLETLLSKRTRPTPVPSDAVEKTIATFKGLDILENNAGVTPKPFAETTPEEIDRVLDINL